MNTEQLKIKQERERLKELVFLLDDAKFRGFSHLYQPWPNAGLDINTVIKMIPDEKIHMALMRVTNELLLQQAA